MQSSKNTELKACFEKSPISNRIQSVEVKSLKFLFFRGGGEISFIYEFGACC